MEQRVHYTKISFKINLWFLCPRLPYLKELFSLKIHPNKKNRLWLRTKSTRTKMTGWKRLKPNFTCVLVWESILHIFVRFSTISKLSKFLFGAAADVLPVAMIPQSPTDLDGDSSKVRFRFWSWHKWRH